MNIALGFQGYDQESDSKILEPNQRNRVLHYFSLF